MQPLFFTLQNSPKKVYGEFLRVRLVLENLARRCTVERRPPVRRCATD